DPFFPDACSVEISTGISPLNNKPHAQISIDNSAQDDNYRFVLIEVRAINTKTKMWAWGNSAKFISNEYLPPTLAGSTSSTMGELGGTGTSIISVGAYTSKNSWTSFTGGSNYADYYVPQGAIGPFSSKGPTADNRTKPDIAAPGNVIIS